MPILVLQDGWEWQCAVRHHGCECQHAKAVMNEYPSMVVDSGCHTQLQDEHSDSESASDSGQDEDVDNSGVMGSLHHYPFVPRDIGRRSTGEQTRLSNLLCSRISQEGGWPTKLGPKPVAQCACEQHTTCTCDIQCAKCKTLWSASSKRERLSCVIHTLLGPIDDIPYEILHCSNPTCNEKLHPNGHSDGLLIVKGFRHDVYDYKLLLHHSDEVLERGMTEAGTYKQMQV